MRTSETCSKLPCILLAPVYSILPSALLQQQRGRLRRCQPHRSRLTIPAIMKKGTVASNSPAHVSIVRDARDAPPFGPRGMLLVGFSKEQGDAAEGWMHQMEPELLISHCTAATLDGTVEQAVTGAGMEQTSAEEHQHGNEVMPRLVLLSGMSGEEAIAIAEHWEEYTGTSPPIISTLVDKLLKKPMRTAVLEIIKAHVSSKKNTDGTVDTAALRQMIRRKMEEKQTAGSCLVSRGGGRGALTAMRQPILVSNGESHHGQGSETGRKGLDTGNQEACKAPAQLDAKQQHMQVAYAKRLLQAASPPKARTNETERRRKDGKEKIVRKGFG